MFGVEKFFVARGCPMHCRIFSTVPTLYSLGASGTHFPTPHLWQPKMPHGYCHMTTRGHNHPQLGTTVVWPWDESKEVTEAEGPYVIGEKYPVGLTFTLDLQANSGPWQNRTQTSRTEKWGEVRKWSPCGVPLQGLLAVKGRSKVRYMVEQYLEHRRNLSHGEGDNRRKLEDMRNMWKNKILLETRLLKTWLLNF